MRLIIDTNVFISALLKDSFTRNLIVNFDGELLCPWFVLEEINKHKEELLKKSDLEEDKFDELINLLLKYVRIVRTEEVIFYKKTAEKIVFNIDIDDAIFFAASLAFESCPIWSDDKRLKEQKEIVVYSSLEVSELVFD